MKTSIAAFAAPLLLAVAAAASPAMATDAGDPGMVGAPQTVPDILSSKQKQYYSQVLAAIRGQLTGTVHCAPGELERYGALVELLTTRVGRVLVNGFPTGVEVCDAMVHGGPFPASTDARFTSVGTNAIKRFLRPVCYQNFPEATLPPALRDANPWAINRLVNGALTRAAL